MDLALGNGPAVGCSVLFYVSGGHRAPHCEFSRVRSGSDDGRARWSCAGPKVAHDLVFSTVEYGPATASTHALRVMRARRRWAMSLATAAERLQTGAPRRSRRLTLERGT